MRFHGPLSSRRNAAIVAAFFLAGLAASFFWPLLFGGRVLFYGDVGLYFIPMLAFQRAEVVGQGRIPLWNPHLLCGTPFVGNPQAWPLYPSSLLLYVLPAWCAVGVAGALHVFLASVGTFAFLRTRGRSVLGALFGAVAWAYGGALISRLQFPNMMQAISYLPWLLFAVERVVQRSSAARVAAVGTAVGLSLLAGHAQATLLSGYLALAWAVFRVIPSSLAEGVKRLVRNYPTAPRPPIMGEKEGSTEATACEHAVRKSTKSAFADCRRLSFLHPRVVRQTAKAVFALLSARIFRCRGISLAPKGGRPRGRGECTAVGLICGSLLGIGLACGQIVPTLELLHHSVRQGLSLAQSSRFILPPYAVVTNFIAPSFYGNPASAESSYIGRGNFWEPCCYLGIVPLLFAFGAMARRFRDAETRFWALIAALCIWLSLGRDAGLYAVAFYLLPGVSRFHDAARFLLPGTFALAALAALGLDALAGAVPSRWRRSVAMAALLVAMADLLPFSARLNPTAPAAVFSHAAPVLFAGRGGRIWHADESAVWGAYVSYRSNSAAETDPEAFVGSLAPNLPEMAGRNDACGYEPVALAGIRPLCDRLKALRAGHRPSAEADRLLDALGVTEIVHWDRLQARPSLTARGERPLSKIGKIRTRNPSPRNGGGARGGGESGMNRSCLAGRALFYGKDAAGRSPLPLPIAEESPERVVIALPASHPAGLVRLADAAYPGWTARVDGIPAPIDIVDGAFQGVTVGTNASRVTFAYQPVSWRVGMFISMTALGILSALLAPSAAGVVRRVCLVAARIRGALRFRLRFAERLRTHLPKNGSQGARLYGGFGDRDTHG